MGLDMYLLRATRIPGFTLDDYLAAEQSLADRSPDMFRDPALCHGDPEVAAFASLVLQAVMDDTGHTTYTPAYAPAPARANALTHLTLFEEVAYWRKANAIHQWFVEHVHDGEDDGYWFAEVPEAACRTLLDTVQTVLAHPKCAPAFLPTQSGFFFGPTKYDAWYRKDLAYTRDQLTAVLASTDFTRQLLIYHPSW